MISQSHRLLCERLAVHYAKEAAALRDEPPIMRRTPAGHVFAVMPAAYPRFVMQCFMTPREMGKDASDA